MLLLFRSSECVAKNARAVCFECVCVLLRIRHASGGRCECLQGATALGEGGAAGESELCTK